MIAAPTLTKAEDYSQHGNSLREKGLLEEAVSSYMQALAMRPDYAEAYGDLGLVFKEMGKTDKAIASYRQALMLKPDYAKAYVNLGVVLHEGGLLEEAAANYKRALTIKSDYVAAYFNLGALHMSLGQTEDALQSFQNALKFKPDLEAASHMVAVLEGKTTQSAPHEFIKNLFNHYANNFESHLIKKLNYTIPQVLFQKFTALVSTDWRRLTNAIDLGCGTGLNGTLFREITDRLIGVDLSENMLKIAATKNAYKDLYLSEIVAFLDESKELYDLFLATDVFIYVGDLEMTFKAIKAHSLPGAYFAFSTESIEEGGFALQKSARYAHSRAYIKSLCRRYGFRIALCEAVNLRKDHEFWIRGDIFILQLSSQSSAFH